MIHRWKATSMLIANFLFIFHLIQTININNKHEHDMLQKLQQPTVVDHKEKRESIVVVSPHISSYEDGRPFASFLLYFFLCLFVYTNRITRNMSAMESPYDQIELKTKISPLLSFGRLGSDTVGHET